MKHGNLKKYLVDEKVISETEISQAPSFLLKTKLSCIYFKTVLTITAVLSLFITG